MGIHEKISEYKSLCWRLNEHYKAIEYAFTNQSANIEKIHMQCEKTHNEIEQCYQEICRIQKKQQD